MGRNLLVIIVLSVFFLIISIILFFGNKSTLRNDRLLLEYPLIFKVFSFINFFLWIIVNYLTYRNDGNLFFAIFIVLSVFSSFYMFRRIIVDRKNDFLIFRNMFFAKKRINLKDVDCIFEQKNNGNLIFIISNKKVFVENCFQNFYEFRLYLRSKNISYRFFEKINEIDLYLKNKK